MDGGTWIFKGKRADEHLTKLNNSHEKVLDSINPRALCLRAFADHKDESCAYQRAHILEFVL